MNIFSILLLIGVAFFALWEIVNVIIDIKRRRKKVAPSNDVDNNDKEVDKT